MAGAFLWDRRGFARLATCLCLGMLAFGGLGRPIRPVHPDQTPAGLHASSRDRPALQHGSAPIRSGLPRIALGSGGQDIRLAGELTEGAAERLRLLLDTHPGITRIHLTSEGGLVEEGRAIGALIAAHALDAYVPDYCVSACTLAFVRGRNRFVRPESQLGFHAPYEDGPSGETIAVDASDEHTAYLAAGIDAAFVAAALAVPASDIWIPDTGKLLHSGVATALVEADRFPDSTLDHAPDLAGARNALLNGIEGARGLEAHARLDTIAARYLAAYRAGRSESAITAEMHRLVAEALAHTSAPEPLADLTR